MNCCQCQGIESLFDTKRADEELAEYRRKGPSKSTQILLEALTEAGVGGSSLLDIGGGVGVIQHELVQAGISRVTNVDASSAYLAVAKTEAARRGYVEQAGYHYGNFVELAPTIDEADIVTLDRVLCCYHDMESLVRASAGRSNRLYGLVFPRDVWWIKLGRPLLNSLFWLFRNPFRLYIHATAPVDTLARQEGLTLRFQRKLFIWQILVYER